MLSMVLADNRVRGPRIILIELPLVNHVAQRQPIPALLTVVEGQTTNENTDRRLSLEAAGFLSEGNRTYQLASIPRVST